MEYGVLPEQDPNSLVAQTEHTIIVGRKSNNKINDQEEQQSTNAFLQSKKDS